MLYEVIKCRDIIRGLLLLIMDLTPVRYSTNCDSTFNSVVVSLELLRTCDVERSPGDTTASQTQIELPNKGL